jgi:hypothetical protein
MGSMLADRGAVPSVDFAPKGGTRARAFVGRIRGRRMLPKPRAASDRRKVCPYMHMSPATRTLSPNEGMKSNTACGALQNE